MTDTLAAVEAHAVALADEPDAPFLDDPLPGRTGRALQVALNRLRASMLMAEETRRELAHAATHDELTGLLNRGAALAMIERDLAGAARTASSVMVLFVDLDDLKLINDRHGHATGDDALRVAASALLAATRKSDVVARIGGDEFLVAGIESDRAEIERLAERVRRAVASSQVITAAGPITLRCSIGAATSGPRATAVDELIKRADAALYAAKGNGRNRVAWDEPGAVPLSVSAS
jgi:diguanylate cyclase (GGDEF)-like protein